MRESIACLLIGLVTGVALTLTQWPDTPSPVSEVIIDTATGCHYLQGAAGGITPRLAPPVYPASQGWHICSGAEGGDDAAWEDGAGKDGEVVL